MNKWNGSECTRAKECSDTHFYFVCFVFSCTIEKIHQLNSFVTFVIVARWLKTSNCFHIRFAHSKISGWFDPFLFVAALFFYHCLHYIHNQTKNTLVWNPIQLHVLIHFTADKSENWLFCSLTSLFFYSMHLSVACTSVPLYFDSLYHFFPSSAPRWTLHTK